MSVGYRRGITWRNTFLLGVFLLLSLSAALLSAASSRAAQTTPYKLNYQGRLTDASGAAKPDGQYNMKFRLYSALSGGTAVWTEVRETTNRVTVTNGQFAVQLGDVTALTPSLFTTQPLYLEVELPTPATATCSTASCGTYTEGAMTPRQTLASSAYAMNADTLDGYDGSSFIVASQNNTYTNGNLFRNTTNSTSAFGIQTATGTSLLNVDTTNGVATIGNTFRAPETAGVPDIGTVQISPGSNSALLLSFPSGSTGGRISTMSVYIDSSTILPAPNNKFRLAIYTNDSTQRLISTSVEGILTGGWNSLPIDAYLEPNTTYVMAYSTNALLAGDNSILAVNEAGASYPTGLTEQNQVVYADGFPEYLTGSSGTLGNYASMYVTYASGNTPNFSADSAGRVGINTVSPVAKLSLTGSGLLKNRTDTSSALSVQSASALTMFTVNTVSDIAQVGSATADGTAVSLVLDAKTAAGSASDPPGTNGGMYYNEKLGKFRCYQNGAWRNCRNAAQQKVRLASDVINNNATANTMQDVTGLSIPVQAGKSYGFSAVIHYTAAVTTTGSRWSIKGTNFDSGTQFYSRYTSGAAAATTNYTFIWDTPATTTTTSLASGNVAIIKGVYQPNGSGVLNVRFASEVAGSAITAKAGSYIEWWEK